MSARDTSSGPQPPAFKPGQKLHRGITLVEASAGTGKTYNITTLVLRLIAEEDIGIDKILVVTYTNAATAELKVRIRRRLAEAVRALRSDAAPKDEDPQNEDEEIQLLWEKAARGGQQTRQSFLERLEDAQQCFDTAPISTIHGFCQRALGQNAFESGIELDLELEPESGPLLDELVTDYISSQLHDADRTTHEILVKTCGLTPDALGDLARAAVADPDMDLLPDLDQYAEVTVEDWLAAARALGKKWSAESDDALGGMEALFEEQDRTKAAADRKEIPKSHVVKHLKANMFKREKVQEQKEKMDAWLTSGSAPVPAKGGLALLEFFSAARVRRGATTASQAARDLADHPLFQACEDLLSLVDPLKTAARVRFAAWVRDAFEARYLERNQQTYQDLLRRLAAALQTQGQGGPLQKALRQRFEAALIDEFQDTDSLQWQIFSRLFGGGDAFLFLIGDPKQAIYGFRGANIHAYLAARDSADEGRTFTMDTNYRSDRGLVQALNHMLERPGVFGEEPGRIEYVHVEAKDRKVDPRLVFPKSVPQDLRAPLQLRLFDKALVPGEQAGVLDKARAWQHLPGRVADDMVALLELKPRLHDPGSAKADNHGFRPLGPGDIAVLVRKHVQADAIQQALREVKIPSVQAGTGSVLETAEALALQRWLDALVTPGRDSSARRAAVTSLFGWTAADLRRAAPADPRQGGDPQRSEEWEAWLTTLQGWAKRLESQGFIRTFRWMMERYTPDGIKDGPRVYQRLLQRPGGERILTNLLHLAELLHQAERERRLHPAGLALWLRRQRNQGHDGDSEAAEIRLETDDAAVRIVTMHRSKGLEFPVVFAPYLWDGKLLSIKDTPQLKVPDLDDPTRRLLDLHTNTKAEPKKGHLARAKLEAQRENLRLLYVTLTRARHRCVFYWGAAKDNETSPLAAVLHGQPDEDGASPSRLKLATARVKGLNADGLLADLEENTFQTAGPLLSVQRCLPPCGDLWEPPDEAPEELACRDFGDRHMGGLWGQASYSDLTRNAKHGEDEGDPNALGRDDDDEDKAEPQATLLETEDAPAPPEEGDAVPLAGFPPGADAGTCLHKVFEILDFAPFHPDRSEDEGATYLEQCLDKTLQTHGFSMKRFGQGLIEGLPLALRTPLGGPLGQTRLCDISTPDRLDELRFELPLAGGHQWGRDGYDPPVHAAQIAAAMNLRTGDDALPSAYLAGLEDSLGNRKLAGFMIGFIDLVFRVGKRWFVADYKSNRMNRHRPKVIHPELFTHEEMVWEMGAHHYFLQYHLYTVALHRFLKQRLGDAYSYKDNFGGVYYLFFRGMVGPETRWVEDAEGRRRTHGVFFDRPQEKVITQMDHIFRDPPTMPRNSSEGGE